MSEETMASVIDALTAMENEQSATTTPVVAEASGETTKPDAKGDQTVEAIAAKSEEQNTEGKSDAELDAEKNGNVDPEALPEEVASHPKVQELLVLEQTAQAFEDALAEGYAIDTSDPKKALEELRQERADAHALYDIVNGKQDAAFLLDRIASNVAPEQAGRVFEQIVNGLARNGFLQAYMRAAGFQIVQADPNAKPDPNAPNPLEARVEQLAKTIEDKERKQAEAALAQQTAAERERVGKAFLGEVERLAKEKGVDPEFMSDYMNGVALQINGNPAIIKRIAAGNFVDVKRLFTLYHNAQVQRFEKWTRAKSTSKQTRDAQVPKAPAGGNPPAPVTSAKRVLTPEERRQQVINALS